MSRGVDFGLGSHCLVESYGGIGGTGLHVVYFFGCGLEFGSGGVQIDFVFPLGTVRENTHPIGKNFDEAAVDGKNVLRTARFVGQDTARFEFREQRRVAGQYADVAFPRGNLDFGHLLGNEHPLRAD